MKPVLVTVAALLLLAALLWIAGALLPREHRVTSRAVLPAPPDSVWEVISDLERIPSWWSEVKASTRLDDQAGAPRFRQSLGNEFDMVLVVKESLRPTRFRTEIEAPPGSPFGGSWIYELSPAGSGTEIRLTEDGWIASPLFRVVSRFTGHHRTMNQYLTALGRRFGAEVKPEAVP